MRGSIQSILAPCYGRALRPDRASPLAVRMQHPSNAHGHSPECFARNPPHRNREAVVVAPNMEQIGKIAYREDIRTELTIISWSDGQISVQIQNLPSPRPYLHGKLERTSWT